MGAPRTAFDADYGTAQGRIRPVGWTAPEGDYAFVLGHDLPGVVRRVGSGDTHMVEQVGITFLPGQLLRARVRLRAPRVQPAGFSSWALFVVATDQSDLTTYDTWTEVIVRQDVDLYDVAISVGDYSQSTGSGSIAFQLELLGGDPVQELELPGVYVDALAVETINGLAIINRLPEPDAVEVPLADTISFAIADCTGLDPLDPSSLTITVNGVQVLVGGVEANGWTASVVQPFGTTYGVELSPPAPFDPETVYTVNILAESLAHYAVSSGYTFTSADTLAPLVVAALALDPLTVRVTFDEEVSADGTGSALDPAAYELALVSGAPAVTPAVVDVTFVGADAVLLTLDRFATRGALYRVTVAGVTDLVGNVVTAPNDSATFTGFAWAVPAGRDIELFKLLPEATQAQDVSGEHARFLGVMQELYDVCFALLDGTPEVFDPDFAPEGFVDLMLAEMGNPFQLSMTLLEKRKLLHLLLPIYQTKGTAPGIIAAFRLFTGITISLRVFAWAPYPLGIAAIGSTFVLGSSIVADIYTFEVLTGVALTAEQRVILRDVLDVMMVAHEHYRIVEPTIEVIYDHWELPGSALGVQTILH